MKILYFIFCYILILFVIHGIVIDQSLMLTIYHRTQIPVLLMLLFYIFKNCNRLPTDAIGKYVFPVVMMVLLILFGGVFHENSNILQELSGVVFFLIVWLYSFIAGFNNPDYLNTYKNKIFWALIILGGIGAILELKAIFLFNITRDSAIRGFSYNSAPFLLAYLLPFALLFRKDYRNIIIVALLLVIILSGKRGPIVGLAGAYLIYVFIYERKFKSIIKYIFFISLLFIILKNIIPEEIQFLIDRFNPEEYEEGDISSHRFDLWEVYFDYYQNGEIINKLLGFGNNSGVLLVLEHLLGRQTTPHNSYIMVLFWYGLISFICFMIFLYKMAVIFKYSFHNMQYLKLYAICFFMLLVCSFYTPGFADNSYMALIIYHILGYIGGSVLSYNYIKE